jgi:hypothetical protein
MATGAVTLQAVDGVHLEPQRILLGASGEFA